MLKYYNIDQGGRVGKKLKVTPTNNISHTQISIPFDLQNLQHHHQLHPHYLDQIELAQEPLA